MRQICAVCGSLHSCAGRLDSVRRGWSAKWAQAFEAVGLDTVEDIIEMDDETVEVLQEELAKAGAKFAHVRPLFPSPSWVPFPVESSRRHPRTHSGHTKRHARCDVCWGRSRS